MDPLFVLLPLLEHYCGKSYRSFQDIITEEESQMPDTALLRRAEESVSIGSLCDQQEVGDQMYWKFNTERTLEWLKKKYRQTLKQLTEMNYETANTVSSFIPSQTPEEKNDMRERSAYEFLSEYLTEEWRTKFKEAEGYVPPVGLAMGLS